MRTAILTFLVAAVAQAGLATSADAAFIRRGKIKQKNTNGYKVVVVVGDDANNDVDQVHVDFASDRAFGCGRVVLSTHTFNRRNGNKRFTGTCPSSQDLAGQRVQLTATMRDARGAVVGEPAELNPRVRAAQGPPRVQAFQIVSYEGRGDYEIRLRMINDWGRDVANVVLQAAGGSALRLAPELVRAELRMADGGISEFRAVVQNINPGQIDSLTELALYDVVVISSIDGRRIPGAPQTVETLPTALPDRTLEQLADLADLESAAEQALALATELEQAVADTPDSPISDYAHIVDSFFDVFLPHEFDPAPESPTPADPPPPCNSAEAQANPGPCL